MKNIIKVWADAIYEMSNGGNYLGKIHFIDNGRFNTACDVFWAKCGVWPNAHVGGFVYHGVISVSDYYKDDYKKCDDFKCECNDYEGVNQKEDVEGMASTFAHESGHYIYGLDDEYGDAEINPQNGDEVGPFVIKNVFNSGDEQRLLSHIYENKKIYAPVRCVKDD